MLGVEKKELASAGLAEMAVRSTRGARVGQVGERLQVGIPWNPQLFQSDGLDQPARLLVPALSSWPWRGCFRGDHALPQW